MPYITKEYYDDEYKGASVLDQAEFDRLVLRAGDVIDMITNQRLSFSEFTKQPIFIQKQVKKAVASQIDYLLMNGEASGMGAGGFGQVSAGSFSYGDKAGSDALSREQQMTSASVIHHLRLTGLLYQGVDVID